VTAKVRVLLACSAAIASSVGVDFFSKAWVFTHASYPGLIPGVFEITRHENYGALGNIAVPNAVLLAISALISIIIAFLILGNRRSASEKIALALILGGGIGNLIDRASLGYVRDWILVGRTSILNLADISIGAGILAYVFFYSRRNRTRINNNQ